MAGGFALDTVFLQLKMVVEVALYVKSNREIDGTRNGSRGVIYMDIVQLDRSLSSNYKVLVHHARCRTNGCPLKSSLD